MSCPVKQRCGVAQQQCRKTTGRVQLYAICACDFECIVLLPSGACTVCDWKHGLWRQFLKRFAQTATQDVAYMQAPQSSVFAQMYYLILRVLRQWKRHPIMLIGEAVQYIFIGAFVGVCLPTCPAPRPCMQCAHFSSVTRTLCRYLCRFHLSAKFACTGTRAW